MNYRRGNFKVLWIAGAMLLSIAACHSSTSGPNPTQLPPPPPPPTPAGYIACTGNYYTYCNVIGNNYPTWYAFWDETADSSSASLRVGSINPSFVDSIFLVRDSIGWAFAPNDRRFGDTLLWYHVRPHVFVTSDSVKLGWMEGIDCGSGYRLKKLN